MRSSTSPTLSTGYGPTYASSIKQKIKRTYSNKVELVTSVSSPKLFGQSTSMNSKATMFQAPYNNLSTIMLTANSHASSSKRIWYINICYFFVANCTRLKEISVEYDPTETILIYFFTKLLTGHHLLSIQRPNPGKVDKWKVMCTPVANEAERYCWTSIEHYPPIDYNWLSV